MPVQSVRFVILKKKKKKQNKTQPNQTKPFDSLNCVLKHQSNQIELFLCVCICMDREESCNNFEELFENRKVNNEGGGEKEEKTCQIECQWEMSDFAIVARFLH